MLARGKCGAEDRGELAAADGRECRQRIGKCRAMMLDRRIDHRGLARQPGIVDAGAAADPIGAGAAEQRCGDRRRGGGVADAHLAEAQQVGVLGDRVIAGRNGGEEIGFGHRRRDGEVGGRPLDLQRHDLQLRRRRRGRAG